MQIPFFSSKKSAPQITRKAVSDAPFASSITSWANYSFTRGKESYLDQYKNWVYACVEARAQEVSTAEFYCEKNEVKLEEGRSELMKLLHYVNEGMTMQELFFGTQAHKDLDGSAFWFLARDNNGKGKIREIYLVRPDRMELVVEKENPMVVAGYVYKVPGTDKKIKFETNQILHFKNFKPDANHPIPSKGKSIVEAAYNSVEADNAAREWNYKFFKNSARPDGVISKKEGSMTTEEHTRLKADLEANYQGLDNAHKMLILTDGLEWKEMSRVQKDMEFIEQRRFSRDEILALFRVPKTVLGIVEDVNRANAEASDYVFASRTVKPLLRSFVDTINEYLGEEFGEELDFEDVVPKDKVANMNMYNLGINRWLTINEIRAEEGLAPVEGGDALKAPDGSEMALKPIAPTKNEGKQKREEYDMGDFKKIFEALGDEEIEIEDVDDSTEKEEEVAKVVTAEQKTVHIDNWTKLFDINEKPFQQQMSKYFAKQEKDVIKSIENNLKGLEPSYFKMKGFDFSFFDEEEYTNLAISIITPRIKQYIKQSSQNAAQTIGTTPLSLDSPLVKDFIEKRSEFFSSSISDTTTKKLLNSLNDGSAKNETLPELVDRVKSIYLEAKTSRAEMIARTEISASANFASIETYKEGGVEKVEWYNLDPEAEECIMNAGKTRAIGEDFPSGDTEPPAHPNCRSTLLPVF